jgi:hypothetical protein
VEIAKKSPKPILWFAAPTALQTTKSVSSKASLYTKSRNGYAIS